MESKHESILDLSQNFPHNRGPTSMYFYGPLMYLWCKQMRARYILEIGIATGYSSYWLGQAAKEAGGKYFGIEIHQGRAKAIDEAMDKLGIPHEIWAMDSRMITTDFMKEKVGKLDFCFLDGDHSVETVNHEMDVIYPLMIKFSYIFIHDVFAASREAWKVVVENPNYTLEHLHIFNNFGMGIIRRV